MKIVGWAGRDDVARAYIGEIRPGRFIEFCESVEPPIPRSRKWVLIVSTMFGCPVGCLMCDAGGQYRGNLSAGEILSQTDFLILRRFPDRCVDSEKFKIQFARMGEPSLNRAVLEVLRELPSRYQAPGLMPSLSSVAPLAGAGFFEDLIDIKRDLYGEGKFQLQFSIHTTDRATRERLIPVSKWDLPAIADYGERFLEEGDRKITLNSALAEGMPLDPDVLLRFFDPNKFLIKITPLNPTYRAEENQLGSYIKAEVQPGGSRAQAVNHAGTARGSEGESCGPGLAPDAGPGSAPDLVEALRHAGYEVIVSIGELEENLIGSNCGQYVMRHLAAEESIPEAYTYEVVEGRPALT